MKKEVDFYANGFVRGSDTDNLLIPIDAQIRKAAFDHILHMSYFGGSSASGRDGRSDSH